MPDKNDNDSLVNATAPGDPTAIEQIKIPANQKGYEATKWAGKDMYVCNGCRQDTFNEPLMKKHIQDVHR